MKLAIPVYQGVNLLDVAGPLEMFYWASLEKPLKAVLVSQDGKPVTSINGVRFEVGGSFDDLPNPDIVWVPGGDPASLKTLMTAPRTAYLDYLVEAAKTATWVCSVCEGAMLLARAGLLDGHNATTHWAFVACLAEFPAITVDKHNERFIVSQTDSGNRLTGGGISSGLDESLKLIELLYGKSVAETVQVNTQYFPKPPVSGKLPAKPPPCRLRWD